MIEYVRTFVDLTRPTNRSPTSHHDQKRTIDPQITKGIVEVALQSGLFDADPARRSYRDDPRTIRTGRVVCRSHR